MIGIIDYGAFLMFSKYIVHLTFPQLFFISLNPHQGQLDHLGFVEKLVIYKEKNVRLVGFHQMHCCVYKSSILYYKRQCGY